VQQLADSGFPHTRARAAHWLATAVAVAGACGLAVLLQPADATAAGPPAGGPDPAAAVYPLDCGPYEIVVTHQAELDLDRDGRAETVVAVRCDAGGGTPPNGVYLLVASAAGVPVIVETLVDPADGMSVDELWVADGTVSARLFGYSGPDVPRSDPDLYGEADWSWSNGRLVRDQAALAPAVTV
jgi:hypothetical protein